MKTTTKVLRFSAAGLLALCLALTGCGEGDQGEQGPPGASGGTVSGTVTNAVTAAPVAGAKVTVSPTAEGLGATTDSQGKYSMNLPSGVYTVSFAAANFTTASAQVAVEGAAVTEDKALQPSTNVAIQVAPPSGPVPGAAFTLTASVTTLDGSTVTGSSWTQKSGAPVTFSAPAAPKEFLLTAQAAAFQTFQGGSVKVTLPAVTAFKDEYFRILAEDRGQFAIDPETAEELIEAGGEPPRNGALLDRTMIMGINPHDLADTAKVILEVTVSTSNGKTYTKDVEIDANLPFSWTYGIGNVPVGLPVLLHGKDLGAEATYSWQLSKPSGSSAALQDATTQNPYFTPDVNGTYTVAIGTTAVTVYAARWQGGISGQDAFDATKTSFGRPQLGNCTICHTPGGAANVIGTTNAAVMGIMTSWRQSGHAEIFSQNFNGGAAGFYDESCFVCHTVGWNLTENPQNGGFDDVLSYTAFLDRFFPENASGVRRPAGDKTNWAKMLSDFPELAQLANVQCENCHGPNGAGGAHTTGIGNRASLSADVCGFCHGEPPRHARFQQWEQSKHADYETAYHEGLSNRCAGCHSAQGAVAWFDQLRSGAPTAASRTVGVYASLGITLDNVHPITCAVCHDPHDPGTMSGVPNDVQPRITGDTPLLPGGFQALGVGKGAICITCHNSRNGEKVAGSGVVGLHEDGDALWGTLTAYNAPHEACQGDVLMGRNAYFLGAGAEFRSKHANISNACTNCHMVQTAPPPELSYQLSGTNHTFRADLGICSKCHGNLEGEGLQAAFTSDFENLRAAIEQAITKLKGDGVPVEFFAARDPQVEALVLPAGSSTPVSLTLYLPGPGSATPLINAAQLDILAKANWNFSLLELDVSKGVHNPNFAFQVINATKRAVQTL